MLPVLLKRKVAVGTEPCLTITKISSPMCCTPSCCMVILSTSSFPLQTNHERRHSAQGAVLRGSSPYSQLTLQKRIFFPSTSFSHETSLQVCACVCDLLEGLTFWARSQMLRFLPSPRLFQALVKTSRLDQFFVSGRALSFLARGRLCVWSFLKLKIKTRRNAVNGGCLRLFTG